MKKLYLIDRGDSVPYEEHWAAVICASSEEECRKLAHEHLDGGLLIDKDCWLNPEKSSVKLIGNPLIEIEESPPILLAAFSAG